MDKGAKELIRIFLRYLIILVVGLNFRWFYIILKPLNLHTLHTILSMFGEAEIIGGYLLLRSVIIELIPACLAGSAFYLLFILILSTKDIKPTKRLIAVILSFLALFLLNIIRILVLIMVVGFSSFETIHWILWHIVSTFLVVGIWVVLIKANKLKTIPIYSDLRFMLGLIKTPKKAKGKHKNNKTRNNNP
jgi:exosortase/archaeosortase family protein